LTALRLQRCEDCGTIAWPVAERCRACLSPHLRDELVDDHGRVLSFTTGHVSFDPAFKDRLPITIGLVRLDIGPVMIVFLPDRLARIGEPCRVRPLAEDPRVFEAVPPVSLS
jgi:uncharacterized OB-fold protein